jgi:AcrR family transcriptional regulator
MPRAASTNKQKIVADFRRSEILAAAKKVFGNKGFEATRMEEIAKAAQLAKGTLYLYFRSKDEIYQATVRQALSEVASLTEQHIGRETSFAARYAAFIRVRIAFWQEQQVLYRLILTMGREPQYRKKSIAWQRESVVYLADLLAEAARAGYIPHQDFTAAAWTTIDAIRGVNERRVFSDASARSVEDDTAFLTTFLLNALRAKNS